MAKLTIASFFEQILSDKAFQNPDTGNLFFPAYIYTYNPEEEYQIRQEIMALHERLIRPDNYVDALILNIFDEFVSYLKAKNFANESLLPLILEKEAQEGTAAIREMLGDYATSQEFFQLIQQKAQSHFSDSSQNRRVFLMLYGFGLIFPYLWTSNYLANFEKYIQGFKLIIFYPGNYDGRNYHLFREFNFDHIYRAVAVDTILKP
jgi:hypothetical protein